MSKFRADCSRCCGLCCVAPAQLALQGFPANKPANRPCDHLDACNRCSIHEDRAEHGFSACEGFDCFGAGQWVTQELFGGADWRASREVATRMFDAYLGWMPRFEAAALLETAMPHVRADAAGVLAAWMAILLSPAPGADGTTLRRQTLALIRTQLERAPGDAR